MLLHLLSDEKFTDYAIKQFSGSAMKSDFIVVSYSEKLQYVSSDVSIINPASDELDSFLRRLNSYSAVVVHGLFWPWMERVIKAVPDSVKVAWVFWGGEIYGRKDLQYTFLASRTRGLLRWQNAKRFIRNRGKAPSGYEMPLSMFQRVDYCLTDVHEDMEFVKKYINSPMKELWYNYYSVEETIGGLMDAECNGQNILIDNSCSIEGNHLEAFHAVRNMPIEGRSVIVPLSYGEPWLRKRLMKKGPTYFGDSFHPLVDFMPREEYNTMVASCAVVVMNHHRQQAFGNIMTALWLGSRVYMSKKSLLYAYFKRIGCILYNVEDDLKPANPQALLPLSAEDREVNRNIIRSIYSKDVMRQRNAEIVRELDGE